MKPPSTKRESVSNVYDEIKAERQRQDAQWGGPDHDDSHSQWDWQQFIFEFASAWRGTNFRQRMVVVAALAVAAIESTDRA